MSEQFFPYRRDKRFLPFWGPLVVRGSHGVRITDDGQLVVTFGWLSLETELTNVDGAHVTGPYRWWTAPGARLSFADDGLTFGTNCSRGVCIHFAEPVPGVIGRAPHSALTVTVEDCDGLVDTLGIDER